jgi:glucose/arabinose dehydrogenase
MEMTATAQAILIAWQQPETNHNGGWMGFSRSDLEAPSKSSHFLYIATGDGGGGNDQHGSLGNSQDLFSLNGKILRLQIPADRALLMNGQFYLIPEDNPFVSKHSVAVSGQGLSEIYAWGLRNP